MTSSDSDYIVEEFIRTKRKKRTTNDDSADVLGNFDDKKRRQILGGTYNDEQEHENQSNSSELENEGENEQDVINDEVNKNHQPTKEEAENSASENYMTDEINTNLTGEQLASLLRGASKINRHVLYVTNLGFETTKTLLEEHFSTAGAVKSIRIPKKRHGCFAFVEMVDLTGFQKAFQLHNTELQGRKIKVQITEAGKKKSANKKNIMKQKNRKLAEMRNEQKTFTKSGKFFDKTLKKEKAKEMLARKRWRKKPTGNVRAES